MKQKNKREAERITEVDSWLAFYNDSNFSLLCYAKKENICFLWKF